MLPRHSMPASFEPETLSLPAGWAGELLSHGKVPRVKELKKELKTLKLQLNQLLAKGGKGQ